jgi:hypothetical protein
MKSPWLAVLSLTVFLSCSSEARDTGANTALVTQDSPGNTTLDSAVPRPASRSVVKMYAVQSHDTNTSGRYRPWAFGQYQRSESGSPSRFLATALRYTTGKLVLLLDTAYRGHADSITIAGLAQHETLANHCLIGPEFDARVVGIVRDTVREKLIKPRLAWMFDTLSLRIRAIPVKSVSCILQLAD